MGLAFVVCKKCKELVKYGTESWIAKQAYCTKCYKLIREASRENSDSVVSAPPTVLEPSVPERLSGVRETDAQEEPLPDADSEEVTSDSSAEKGARVRDQAEGSENPVTKFRRRTWA